MKDTDFISLDVESTLNRLLDFCQRESKVAAVHWLSAYGLSRVMESSDETWHWAFSTVDVAGKHVLSRPEMDLWDLFHVWRKVGMLYPQPWKGAYAPEIVRAAPNSYYALPLAFEGTLQGILLFEGMTQADATAFYTRFKTEIAIATKYVVFAYQHLEAKNFSYIDELTGLYNQRYLPMVLEHELQRSKRDEAQFSLLFLDVDYFKMVNDGRGHWVGSKLLGEIAKILKSQVRSCDYAFRYGGDEFIVLLGSSNSENSKKVAERVRKAVEDHTFMVEGHQLNLTVSIGLASYPQHAQTAAGLIQLADQAMYYGKRKSRNIVFVAS